jgi:hypothetical protein
VKKTFYLKHFWKQVNFIVPQYWQTDAIIVKLWAEKEKKRLPSKVVFAYIYFSISSLCRQYSMFALSREKKNAVAGTIYSFQWAKALKCLLE